MPKRTQPDDQVEAESATGNRACDTCRARKVRCDKLKPCSACKASKIQCRTSPRSPQPQRKRIHLTAEYENKLNQIHARLEDLDNVLKNSTENIARPSHNVTAELLPGLMPSNPAKTHQNGPSSTDVVVTEVPSLEIVAADAAITTFEGETSMAAQSSYARNLLEQAIKTVPLTASNPTMASALDQLKKLTTESNPHLTHATRVSLDSKPAVDIRKLPLPPVEIVLDVLRWARETTTFLFTPLVSFSTLADVTELCRSVFFSLDPYPASTAVMVHGHLANLLHELSWATEDTIKRTKLIESMNLCYNNFAVCLGSLSILSQDTPENLGALLFGAIQAIQESRPGIAWKLNAVAASMCMSLGWHCATSYADDSPEVKASKLNRFWNVYVIDRSLSLRLGRAAILQDYDIDVDLPCFGPSLDNLYTARTFALWVNAARIQGEVYTRLYSPLAIKNGPEPGDLLEQIQSIRKKLSEIAQMEPNLESSPSVMEDNLQRASRMMNHGDIVACSMIETMVYRALQDPIGCLDSARRSLDLHQVAAKECDTGRGYTWNMYLHWTILHVPCAPFIVVFCNVLATSDQDDLRRLHEFTQTLESGTTKGLKKFQLLCQTFCQVASLYVEARQAAMETPEMPDLTFGASELNTVLNGDMEVMMNGSLGEWFTGHQYLLDLLDDTSFPHNSGPR